MALVINLVIFHLNKAHDMKLIVDKDKFKMAFISGPRHNFLSLSIVNNKLRFNFELNDLNNKDSNQNHDEIKEQIIAGLEQANRELNSDFRISLAEYSSLDTFSDHIYHDLTVNIIKEAYANSYINKL